MTQALIAINGMILAAMSAVAGGAFDVFLTGDGYKAAVVAILGIIQIGLAAFLPKVSAAVRRVMELQNRG